MTTSLCCDVTVEANAAKRRCCRRGVSRDSVTYKAVRSENQGVGRGAQPAWKENKCAAASWQGQQRHLTASPLDLARNDVL